jgi:hypothetical protein
VLLYEGEELVGAKQNRIIEQTILAGPGSSLKIPAKCVERGRWARRSQHFAPAPQAAYPQLRKATRLGQGAVWGDVAAKSARLRAFSPTDASESMYVSRSASLEEYVQALPRTGGPVRGTGWDRRARSAEASTPSRPHTRARTREGPGEEGETEV